MKNKKTKDTLINDISIKMIIKTLQDLAFEKTTVPKTNRKGNMICTTKEVLKK